MQASTWICTYQMQTNKVHELAPPTCVLVLFKNLDPSWSILMLLPLSMSIFDISLLKYIFCCPTYPNHIFVPISPPLSSISIKGMSYQLNHLIPIWKSVHLIVTKDRIWDRWLRLESCIFDGHHHMCWNDITWIALEIPHRIFDLDIIWWGTPPMS